MSQPAPDVPLWLQSLKTDSFKGSFEFKQKLSCLLLALCNLLVLSRDYSGVGALELDPFEGPMSTFHRCLSILFQEKQPDVPVVH